MAIIAVDLKSNDLTTAAISKSGRVMSKENLSIQGLQGKEVSQLIQKQINKLFKTFEDKPFQIKSVGISVPGIYFSKTGTVWAPNIKGWENYPLKEDLSHFYLNNIRVKIASKRTCDILGERWLGAAKKSKNAIYLSVGKGIGAGILIDGKILHGHNDGVGAAGWLTIGKPFKKEYAEKGYFEFFASEQGIKKRIDDYISSHKNYNGKLKKDSSIKEIVEAFKQKDAAAVRVLDDSIEIWGMASANLISLFNPEIIVFGGSVFGPALIFLDKIKKEAEKWAQPIFIENVEFVESKLRADAGLFGAGHLAIGKF